MVLALLPFAPVKIWTASRYTYGAVAFFAPLAAIAAYGAYDRVRRTHRLVRVPATVARPRARRHGRRALRLADRTRRTRAPDARPTAGNCWSTSCAANYQSVPPGTTIYIVDGPWTNPMEQYTWVPSVARAVYGDAAAFDLPRASYAADPPKTDKALFLEFTADGLRPVPAEQVMAPH